MVAGSEGRARLDPQIDLARRDQPSVVGAIDEEPPGPYWRQAGERHGQPIGVDQRLGDYVEGGKVGQDLGDRGGLIRLGGEGIDAPDVLVLVLLNDREGEGLGGGIGFQSRGGGLGLARGPRAMI